jgi:hypothetical protein
LFGVLLVRLLQNGFVLIGVPSLWEQVITGALLIGVLILDALAERSANDARLAPTAPRSPPVGLASPFAKASEDKSEAALHDK